MPVRSVLGRRAIPRGPEVQNQRCSEIEASFSRFEGREKRQERKRTKKSFLSPRVCHWESTGSRATRSGLCVNVALSSPFWGNTGPWVSIVGVNMA